MIYVYTYVARVLECHGCSQAYKYMCNTYPVHAQADPSRVKIISCVLIVRVCKGGVT